MCGGKGGGEGRDRGRGDTDTNTDTHSVFASLSISFPEGTAFDVDLSDFLDESANLTGSSVCLGVIMGMTNLFEIGTRCGELL